MRNSGRRIIAGDQPMRANLTKALLAAAAVTGALSMGALPATSAQTGLVGTRVDNFMLADQTGMGHELYYHRAQPAVVILTVAAGDPASDRALAAMSA